jgi:hypothetical protein
MAATPMDSTDGQDRAVSWADVLDSDREFNASNTAHEDLWTRVHQTGDAVCRAVDEWDAAQRDARKAHDYYQTIQAEHRARELTGDDVIVVTFFLPSAAAIAEASPGPNRRMNWLGLILGDVIKDAVAGELAASAGRVSSCLRSSLWEQWQWQRPCAARCD